MWTMATCYAFAPRLGALFPMGFGWVPWGVPPMLSFERVALRLPYKENRLGCLYWKDERSFPSWFWSSLKFKVSNHHIPKKRCRSCEAKQKQYHAVGAPVFFGRKWFGHCFVVQVHLVVGNVFFGGGKGVQEASNCWSNVFFLKFSAAKYVTQTPFFDAMYMKSLCATSFPALALSGFQASSWIHIPTNRQYRRFDERKVLGWIIVLCNWIFSKNLWVADDWIDDWCFVLPVSSTVLQYYYYFS